MSREIKVRSAGGVVIGPDGRVVVVSQSKFGWSLPKGHVDPGEDDLTAAKREIYEECGVTDLTLVRKLPEYERSKPVKKWFWKATEVKTMVFFLFTTNQTKLESHDAYNPETRWIAKEDVAAMLWHPEDKKFFTSILKTL